MSERTYTSLSPADRLALAEFCPPRFIPRIHDPEVFREAVGVLGRWWEEAGRVLRERGRGGVLDTISALEAQIGEADKVARRAALQSLNLRKKRDAAIQEWRLAGGREERVRLSDVLEADPYAADLHASMERAMELNKAAQEQAQYLRSQLGITWGVLNRFDRHGDTLAPAWQKVSGEKKDKEQEAASPQSLHPPAGLDRRRRNGSVARLRPSLKVVLANSPGLGFRRSYRGKWAEVAEAWEQECRRSPETESYLERLPEDMRPTRLSGKTLDSHVQHALEDYRDAKTRDLFGGDADRTATL